MNSPGPKWRTVLGLLLLIVASVLDLAWIWGVLFLLWVVPDLFRGVTYFIDEVRKDEHPVLYWAVVATWIVLSVYYFAVPTATY